MGCTACTCSEHFQDEKDHIITLDPPVNTAPEFAKSKVSHFELFDNIHSSSLPNIQYLLGEHEVDINAQNNHRETPLIYACRMNATPAAMMLLNYKELNVNMEDLHGNTALLYAVTHPEMVWVVQTLLEKNADV